MACKSVICGCAWCTPSSAGTWRPLTGLEGCKGCKGRKGRKAATLQPTAAGNGAPPALEPRAAVEAITLIDDAHQSLERNPNETLLLQALLVRLPILRVTAPV